MTHGAVVVSPEQALKPEGPFMKLWHKAEFTSKIISITWDEAHCVSAWGRFRKEYKEAGRLRYIIPRSIPYLLPSATLPREVRSAVVNTLQVREGHEIIQRSNDCPNILLAVRKIQHSLSSFKDLVILISHLIKSSSQMKKFLVFFDNIEDSITAMEALKAHLPAEYHTKLAMFNSDNTPMFREYATLRFKEGTIFGLYCTDAFGMVCDGIFLL